MSGKMTTSMFLFFGVWSLEYVLICASRNFLAHYHANAYDVLEGAPDNLDFTKKAETPF